MPREDIARIDDLIVTVRGQRVILAADLARIYGVQTRVLNQAVKRNSEKFPRDFVFRLTLEEAERAQRSRSQLVILKCGSNIKYLPFSQLFRIGVNVENNVPNVPNGGEDGQTQRQYSNRRCPRRGNDRHRPRRARNTGPRSRTAL